MTVSMVVGKEMDTKPNDAQLTREQGYFKIKIF